MQDQHPGGGQPGCASDADAHRPRAVARGRSRKCL